MCSNYSKTTLKRRHDFIHLLRILAKQAICALLAISIISSSNCAIECFAQQTVESVINREHDIKAAYIYNFCKYIQWPKNNRLVANNSNIFVIGVIGNSPITTSLTKVARKKKSVRDKRLVIDHWKSNNDFKACHVVFVTKNAPKELLQDFLRSNMSSSVLLVGEEEGFATDFGVINFFIDQNKIRFEINASSAEQQELKISAKLMQLGRIANK